MSLITNRVSFIFYFLPAVPAFCLGLGMAFDELIGFFRTGKMASFKGGFRRRPKAVSVLPLPIAEAAKPPAVDQGIASPETPAAAPPVASVAPALAREEQAVSEVLPPPKPPKSHRRRTAVLRWSALSFIVLFFLVHFASFIILSPATNNWHIENWFS